ncbi:MULTISPECIES: hypothetical protein [Citrobacter]|uniref:hypothetical protein n=1 Tax=Citrobacter TaxID=544 RepID=UPI00227B07F7|nr:MULTISPECIES: hypothetical protein [Citrobacter]MDC8910534.1 hypothetical protein [Citrobacter freundii]MDM2902714.1 hypothetical protein [Citrobacter sp. Cpo037]MDM3343720.1 hypothetical protein [Citrobacter sp. Cf115]
MSNNMLTSENLDDETLAELIEFRRTTLKHHTDKENKTQAILHNMVLVALLELQERRKPQRPVAFLNDAHLNRGYVEGGVTSDDDAPGMIPVYREPVGVVYVSCLPESEFDELQERRKADSAEPIGWTDAEELRSVEKDGCGYLFKANPISPNADPRRVIKLYRHAQPAPVMNDDLYKLANHVASSKNGLPEEWQDWAEELESEIRRAAMLRTELVSEPDKLRTVSFYRDGIEAAANWVDQQRESYDSEHGRQDDETGSFEFGNDAQREYSDTLAEIAEGIRALHPNAGIRPAPEVN